MKPLSYEEFEMYWERTFEITDEATDVPPIWVPDESVYLTWTEDHSEALGGKCYGMKTLEGNLHGIVRIEHVNGTIEEGTWYGLAPTKTGAMYSRHGLRRLINDYETLVQLWHFDELAFSMSFGPNFMET
jgi:hypothetical protein